MELIEFRCGGVVGDGAVGEGVHVVAGELCQVVKWELVLGDEESALNGWWEALVRTMLSMAAC